MLDVVYYFMNSFHFRRGWMYYASCPVHTILFTISTGAQRTRIPTSAHSIGFCVIWVCVSSSLSCVAFNRLVQGWEIAHHIVPRAESISLLICYLTRCKMAYKMLAPKATREALNIVFDWHTRTRLRVVRFPFHHIEAYCAVRRKKSGKLNRISG